ncbi:MAG: hypothetical protein IPH88_01650 [Bacteroidales bacterium]|nr:hypothetical protein [Bacteroidales bacterium]
MKLKRFRYFIFQVLPLGGIKLSFSNLKQYYRFLSAIFLLTSIGFVGVQAQVTTIYSQNFGTGTAFPTGWTPSGSSSWTVVNASSSTPAPPFSGGSNMAGGSSTSSRSVSYSNNLSTVGYTSITVIWSARRSSAKTLTFEWSADGSNWNTLSITDVPSNSTWAWINGGTGTAVSLPVGAAGASNLSFRWTCDTDGNSGAYRLDDFTVAGCKLPDPPGTITGNASICAGSSQNYSVINVAGVTYTWSFPAGWVQTAGGTSNSITVTTNSTPGNVTVTPSNSCGSGTASTKAVTILAIPGQPGTVTGNSSPCVGSSQSYSVPNIAGVTYTWSFPSGWVQTSGGTTNSIQVTVGASSGNITITPSNACGSGTSRTLAVTPVAAVPSQPGTITGSNSPCLGTIQTYSVTNIAGVTSIPGVALQDGQSIRGKELIPFQLQWEQTQDQ